MNSLEESVAEPVVVKVKKTRKPKKVAEPEPLLVDERVSLPVVAVSLPVVPEPVPEPEPVAVCESCGEELTPPFSEGEMDIYRRISAYKRKLLRLKKVACVSADV